MIASSYVHRLKISRRKKHGEQPWQAHHWRAKDANKGVRKHKYSSIQVYKRQVGIRPTASTWTTLDKVDISCNEPKNQRTRFCTRWFSNAVTQTFKRVAPRIDKILRKQCRCCSVVEQNKEEKILPSRKIKKQDKGMNQTRRSKKNWGDQVETGKKPSLKNHQLLRRHGHPVGGTVTSGKKAAGNNTNGGKTDE